MLLLFFFVFVGFFYAADVAIVDLDVVIVVGVAFVVVADVSLIIIC